ncbi:MAG: sigma-70 family RNA polymerase sigma factor [Pseudomonadota bacterium]
MVEERDALTDAGLIERIANGDMTAMHALYLAQADTVRRFVRSRIRDEFEAADIVHETMLAAWRGAANFQGRASVRSWLLSIAKNRAIDHIRKQARVTLAEPDETIPDEDPDAEAVIAAAQDAARLRACVDELSEAHRAAVHLAFYEDMTCAEIAEVEQVPTGTIKTRIFHAKKLIMRCLDRCVKKL